MNITAILPWKIKCINVYLTTEDPCAVSDSGQNALHIGISEDQSLQELYTILFEMTQPQTNKRIHLLSEILRRTLKRLVNSRTVILSI